MCSLTDFVLPPTKKTPKIKNEKQIENKLMPIHRRKMSQSWSMQTVRYVEAPKNGLGPCWLPKACCQKCNDFTRLSDNLVLASLLRTSCSDLQTVPHVLLTFVISQDPSILIQRISTSSVHVVCFGLSQPHTPSIKLFLHNTLEFSHSQSPLPLLIWTLATAS